MGGIIMLIAGVAIGYLFKPQLEVLVGKTIKAIKDNKNKDTDDQ